jgi:hypothetical protein
MLISEIPPMNYTRRVQTVLTNEQFETLNGIAAASGKPLSQLIREAVETTYVEVAARDRRRAALADLLSAQAPVGDWEHMEAEIEEGALE